MKETQMPPACAANLVANGDNTACVVESISLLNNNACLYYDTSLRLCIVLLLKSKTTDTKDPRKYIFKFLK